MRTIIGVDEAGRGSLAGIVVAAAVILPSTNYDWINEIRDSKKLTAKKRQELAELITSHSVWAIRDCPEWHIDQYNILKSTLRAMQKAVMSVFSQVNSNERNNLIVFVDGITKIPDIDLVQETIKGGDDIYKQIGAASIIAKVYRDNYMIGMDNHYPEYGFCRNAGYGTEEHRKAIMVHGPCKLHRKTFRGVREYV